MTIQKILGLAAIALLPTQTLAETFSVKMLNKGQAGAMVFEPSVIRVSPGDVVRFVAATRGHNAESIEAMVPDGASGFAGKLNEEIEFTPTVEGYYGIMCKPHFAMGMVMIVVVGDAVEPPAEFLAGRIPPRAKQRFSDQLAELSQ